MVAKQHAKRSNKDTDGFGDALGAVKSGAGELGKQLRGGVRAVKEQAVEKVGEVADTVRDEVATFLDEQKGRVAGRVDGVASTVDQVARVLHAAKVDAAADYVRGAVDSLDGLARYLEDSDVEELIDDAGDVARRHPVAVMGGLFVLGVMAGRVLAAAREAEPQRAPATKNGARSARSGTAARKRR